MNDIHDGKRLQNEEMPCTRKIKVRQLLIGLMRGSKRAKHTKDNRLRMQIAMVVSVVLLLLAACGTLAMEENGLGATANQEPHETASALGLVSETKKELIKKVEDTEPVVVRAEISLPALLGKQSLKIINFPVTANTSMTVLVNKGNTEIQPDIESKATGTEKGASTEEQNTYDISVANIVATVKANERQVKALAKAANGFLLEIEQVDKNYHGQVVPVTGNDRYVLEHLVMGEAGNQGFEGAALVAQCIRDAMVYDGYDTVESVRVYMKYSGSLGYEPNQDVLDAVEYVFDQGGSAVQHRILYFYSGWQRGKRAGFHETQNFIIQHGGHRFFDRWDT